MIPGSGRPPPVLGRTFISSVLLGNLLPEPPLPEPGAEEPGVAPPGVVVSPRSPLKEILALNVASLAGTTPKSFITLVGLQGLVPLPACTIWTGNDTGSALGGGTGPGGNLGTSVVPV
jgi:hypothetical protein